MPIILIIVGVIAALGLGGYFWESRKSDAVTPTPIVETVPTSTAQTPTAPTTTTTSTETAYKDGVYTAAVNYNAPDRMSHPVTLHLTIVKDIVTASDISFGTEAVGATADYQKKFTAAYKTQVIGKSLDSINLARVGGASLTSNAFNEAKAKVAAEAKV